MELGATVCVPAAPRCANCPVALVRGPSGRGSRPAAGAVCRSRPSGWWQLACAAVERAGQVLLVRRAPGTLLGNTWTLPAAELGPDAEAAALAAGAAPSAWPAHGPARAPGPIRHIFTHRDVTAEVFRFAAPAAGAAGEARGWARARSLAPDESRCPASPARPWRCWVSRLRESALSARADHVALTM